MRKAFTIIECLIVLFIFAMLITVIALTVKGCSVIQEKGIKNVATGIWEGNANTNSASTNQVK